MRYWVLLFVTICFLSACQKEDQVVSTKNEIKMGNSRIENGERLYHFSKSSADHQSDKIRITQYTKEGDPIYQDINYDGKTYKYKLDTTEDKFGVGEIRKTSCQMFHMEEKNNEMTAVLEQCGDALQIELFTLQYDSSKEGRFDFALKYGANLENVIDTNNAPMENKDKNIVLKNLVFINYQIREYEQDTCTTSKMKYDLTVWINEGKKHYKWSDCDKEEDAKDFTELAETIIQVYKNQ
ncbi:DUF4362 domain-containing protein [Bacillus sp. NEB1478]|uniref:DUF4362 domain-containing protein n=1 Tax=Bacillus sp. NEB1478 TaxID=3073816 RepID=UPI002872F5D5|nr:DUF4362 domain-containing protein [Bacillus sp. NEB1478]WNB91095.1 DUF4362 domain-containing protein [Bacillus sp. NEB1478]